MPEEREWQHGQRFDEIAARYDQERKDYPIREQVRQRVKEVVLALHPKRVVDLGCGTGELLLQLASQIESGVGLDVSREMLREARRKQTETDFPHLHFQEGSFLDWDASLLPVGWNGSVELIVSTYAFHHLSTADQQLALHRVAALLMPGGTFVLGDLMFFEPPEQHREEFNIAGYNPEHDQPETVAHLKVLCHRANLSAKFESVHPLAGLLIAQGETAPPSDIPP